MVLNRKIERHLIRAKPAIVPVRKASERTVEAGNNRPWLIRLTSSPLGLTIAAVAGLLAGVASTTESIDKIAVWTGLRPNALQLAKNDEKEKFSRDLTRSAWRRMYLMRRYLLAVKANYVESEIAKEWDRYLLALEEWNGNLMVNILSLEQYYGDVKRNEFEGKIQPAFGTIHYCIERLRDPKHSVGCRLSENPTIAQIEAAIDRLNGELYCFVSGLSEEHKRCQ